MALIPPLGPIGSFSTINSISNITPFTQRDGYTYLQYLEALRDRITQLIEIDTERNELITNWTTESAKTYQEFTKMISDKIEEITASIIGYTVAVGENSFTIVLSNGDEFTAYTNEGVNAAIGEKVELGIGAANEFTVEHLASLNVELTALISAMNDSLRDVIASGDASVKQELTTAIDSAVVAFNQQIGNLTIHIDSEINNVNDLLDAANIRIEGVETLVNKYVDVEPNYGKVTFLTNNGQYDAFPDACMTGAGSIILTFGRGSNHFNMASAKVMRKRVGANWETLGDIPQPAGLTSYGVVACTATQGLSENHVYTLTMTGSPYRSWLNVSKNDGSTWDRREFDWGFSEWAFPNDLYWINDGSQYGALYATCYGDAGATIRRSLDKDRRTWETVATSIGGRWNQGYSETTLAQYNNVLYAAIRHEPTEPETPSTKVYRKNGSNWQHMATLPYFKGNARLTITENGTFVIVGRYNYGNSAGDVTAISTSRDGSNWYTRKLNSGYDMYGRYVEIAPGVGRIFGANQSRTDGTKARIWVMDANATMKANNDTGWQPLMSADKVTQLGNSCWRVDNGIAYLTGSVGLNETPTATGIVIGYMPDLFGPRNFVSVHVTVNGPGDMWVRLTPDGVLMAYATDDTITRTIDLAAMPPFPVK